MVRHRMVLVWSLIAAVCSVAMIALPGSETVPYHIAWAAFALCFGIEQWSPRSTWVSLGVFTFVTGAILVYRVSIDVLDWQETSEIPLMLLLMALMIWHVRRRQQALSELTVNAARERADSTMRELLTLRTSHEMRSPLMISRGYLEMLMDRTPPGEDLADLQVVDEELARLTRVCERLVRSMRVGSDLEVTEVELDAVLHQTAERWSAVAQRRWKVESSALTLECSGERLRACLDTLIENALRYTTHDDDTVLLYARPMRDAVAIGVADSGRGFTTDMLRSAATRDLRESDERGPGQEGLVLDGTRDDLSQTGLGLSLVRDVATRLGGWVQLGVSPWGGADVAMILPVRHEPAVLPVVRPTPVSAPAAPERVSLWRSGVRHEPDAGTGARSA
ncbi:HAMP domain-containing sensor histidine kinase [Terrabacter sp. LjRoot27]|uniref:sensor histidine kinase n=1 Tax=Terrabacter sp. LjRoot27 TaxID=3342306 RepID=UPI003ECC195D